MGDILPCLTQDFGHSVELFEAPVGREPEVEHGGPGWLEGVGRDRRPLDRRKGPCSGIREGRSSRGTLSWAARARPLVTIPCRPRATYRRRTSRAPVHRRKQRRPVFRHTPLRVRRVPAARSDRPVATFVPLPRIAHDGLTVPATEDDDAPPCPVVNHRVVVTTGRPVIGAQLLPHFPVPLPSITARSASATNPLASAEEDHVTTGRVVYHCRPPTSRGPVVRRQLPGFTVPFPRVALWNSVGAETAEQNRSPPCSVERETMTDPRAGSRGTRARLGHDGGGDAQSGYVGRTTRHPAA